MKNYLISIFGDKLKLVSSHSERAERRHSNRINRQLKKEKPKFRNRQTFLMLEIPGFKSSGMLDQMRINLPQTYGLIGKYGMF